MVGCLKLSTFLNKFQADSEHTFVKSNVFEPKKAWNFLRIVSECSKIKKKLNFLLQIKFIIYKKKKYLKHNYDFYDEIFGVFQYLLS